MKKIKNVFRYLHYTFGLLKLNIGTLLVFELLYKFASMAVFKPLLTWSNEAGTEGTGAELFVR